MEMNLASILDINIRMNGEYDQLIFLGENEKRVLTNVEIKKQAEALAVGLKSLGVVKGDIVGVMLSNRSELPELMNGVMRMGAVFLPIIFMLTPPEIRYILEDSNAGVIVTEAELWPKMKEAIKGLNTVKKVIVIGDTDEKSVGSYDELIDRTLGQGTGTVVDVTDDDLAILMYTSGTTGFPKGVMLTHSNLTSNMESGLEYWPSEKGDRTLITVPLNHIYGILLINESLYVGGSTVLFSKFNAKKVLDVIAEYSINIIPLVPTMIIMMLQEFNPALHSMKSMKRMISAGAPLAEETWKKAQSTFGVKLHHGYGCTEASPTISRQRWDREFKMSSVGYPLPGVTVRLLDDNDREVPQGQEGEIVAKGPNIMKGYLNKPEETAKALRDGWLYTGDLGRFDKDGELYITGRKKDLIIKGGENIDPGVIENHLLKHPDILYAAVVSIPDEKYGEDVGAAVVLQTGKNVTEDDLLKFIRQHVHHFVAPKRIYVFDELPVSSSGKILKREIRRIIAEYMKKGM
jgi:long-chain acyl-CoA synthetase